MMKTILKSFVQGMGIGGIAGVVVNKADDYLAYLPKWVRYTLDIGIGIGIISAGVDLVVDARERSGEFDPE